MNLEQIKDYYVIEADPEIADIYLNQALCDNTLIYDRVPVSVVKEITDIISFDNSKITGSTADANLYYKYENSLVDGEIETVRRVMIAFKTEDDLNRFYQVIDDELMMVYVRDNQIYRSFSGWDVRTAMTAFNHLKKFHDMILYKGVRSFSDTLIDRLNHDLEIVNQYGRIIGDQYASSTLNYEEIIIHMEAMVPKMKHPKTHLRVFEIIALRNSIKDVSEKDYTKTVIWTPEMSDYVKNNPYASQC